MIQLPGGIRIRHREHYTTEKRGILQSLIGFQLFSGYRKQMRLRVDEPTSSQKKIWVC